MFNNLKSTLFALTVEQWAIISGSLGFILSVWLSISRFAANRLRVKLESFEVAVFAKNTPEMLKKDNDFVHFVLVLSNKTSIPFSVTSICLKIGNHSARSSSTIYTYPPQPSDGADKPEVGAVVVSTPFPVRFDAYESRPLFLTIKDQHIAQLFRNPLPPLADSHTAVKRVLARRTYRRQTPQSHPRLTIQTSRGKRALFPFVSEVRNQGWIKTYATQKAAAEEKLTFPK
jgi:hypothetical protein